jgi:hypothetical protein
MKIILFGVGLLLAAVLMSIARWYMPATFSPDVINAALFLGMALLAAAVMRHTN